MNNIKLATRNSPLALKQANIVSDYLIENKVFDKVSLLPMTTAGDKVDSQTFKRNGGKGLFLKELENSLLSKDADIAIHSMKDVPAKLDSRFSVSTIMKREDARDVFISEKYKRLADIESGVIGSSSPRRQAMVKNKYCKIETREIRGNIQTRLKKLKDNQLDGIILARAGLERMNLSDLITESLNLNDFIPSPGQGILCLEYLSTSENIIKKIKKIVDINTEICSVAERLFAENIDGDCLSPIGAHAVIKNNQLTLTGYVGSLDGKDYIKNKISGRKDDYIKLSNKLSDVFIKLGAKRMLK
jgi:hydroxymethylbilane synthase